MKLAEAASRVSLVLIAASMIGCGNRESNSGDALEEARAGPTAERGGSAPARDDEVRQPAQSGTGRDPATDDVAGGAAAATDAGTAPATGGSTAPATDGSTAPATILFIGTSLTAGLGLPETQSFPLLVERRVQQAGLPYRVVNAGVSGETSAGALRRIDWLLRQPFEVVVLETGANDMLRGVDPSATEQNIQAIIDRIRSENPDAVIVLAGMMALPNMGAEYGSEFQAIYPRLAERNGLPFIPFLLEGVGGERDLNQSDGVHPNAEGHQIIAETAWRVLEPLLTDPGR